MADSLLELKQKRMADLAREKTTLKKSSPDVLLERAVEAKERSQSHGSAKEIFEQFRKEGAMNKIIAGARTVGLPFQALESAVANPAMMMQGGNFNPAELIKASVRGVTGQQFGEIGDVLRGSRTPVLSSEPVAMAGGLALTMTPLKGINAIRKGMSRTFSGLMKGMDKNVLVAGKSLVTATDEAVKTVGTKVNEAYKPFTGISVPSSEAEKVVYGIADMPKEVVSAIEESVGKIDDLAQKMTVGDLRKVKQLIGKYRPSSFGKEAKGAVETIADEKIDKAYGVVASTIQNIVKSTHGQEAADALLQADKAFWKTERASRFIKKVITEQTLKEPTKGGAMATKLAVEGDLSGRSALNTIRQASTISKKNIDKALDALEAYNRHMAVVKTTQRAFSAGLFGGAVGGLGGYLGSKIYRGE